MKQDNNFNLVRLILSTAVLLSHAAALSGTLIPAQETFSGPWDIGFGGAAVQLFFAVSGYLVTQSYMRRGSLLAFSANRFLRLTPGLIIASLISSFLLARYNGYPGNAFHLANGSLWTIPWEILCYIICGLMGALGLFDRRAFNAIFILLWGCYLFHYADYAIWVDRRVTPMLMSFLTGAFLAVNGAGHSSWTRFTAVLLILLSSYNVAFMHMITSYVNSTFLPGIAPLDPAQLHLFIHVLMSTVLVISVGNMRAVAPWLREDISYGLYIYAWPVTQVLVFISRKHFGLSLGWQSTFSLSLLISGCIAFSSWRLIERPALSFKKTVQQYADRYGSASRAKGQESV
jgi:peptidoglycan/LPS O-acetylase OafA/YrhL